MSIRDLKTQMVWLTWAWFIMFFWSMAVWWCMIPQDHYIVEDWKKEKNGYYNQFFDAVDRQNEQIAKINKIINGLEKQ